MKTVFLALLTLLLCFFVSHQTKAQQTKTANAAASRDLKTKKADDQKLAAMFGNVQSGEKSVCLKIQNPNLKIGDKVQIVAAELPQKTFEAQIAQKAACQEKNFGDLDGGDITEYQLKSTDKKFLNFGYGIGVATAQKILIVGKRAVLNLGGKQKINYFRECTSMEGLHLTVWQGKPLTGKIVWRSYYGLVYNTVPTCRDKDFEGIHDNDQ